MWANAQRQRHASDDARMRTARASSGGEKVEAQLTEGGDAIHATVLKPSERDP